MRRYLIFRIRGSEPTITMLDAMSVISVDHDSTRDVAPDGAGGMHTLGPLRPPVRAQDRDSSDVLALILREDEAHWEGVARHRDPDSEAGRTDGIEVDFPRPADVMNVRLVVNSSPTSWAQETLWAVVQAHGFNREAWLRSVPSDTTEAARLRASVVGDASLRISVWTVGGWEPQGAVMQGSPEMTATPLDLSRSIGNTVRVRLEETPGFWRIDRVAIDTSPDPGVLVQEVRPETVRGARERDVRGLLITEDSKVLDVAPADTVALRFEAPLALAGRSRTYFVQTTCWERLIAPATGQPDPAATSRMSGPGALARFSVQRRNALLETAATPH
ncbi:MAG: hypothetical protein ACRENN_00465 [Candidatus Eiseniibacteriota bacterium]